GRITGSVVKLTGSGRTDAGVHAAGQVANFYTTCPIPCANLQKALNNTLPATIRIRGVEEAPPVFHARYDAKAKTYRYRILQAPVCPPFLARFVHHETQLLDRRMMALAAKWIEGEHDFTSFVAAGVKLYSKEHADRRPPSKPAVRTIFSSRLIWRPRTRLLIYEIRGSGFLLYMVRNIVGTLIEVGRGRIEPEGMGRILKARDRSLAGPTAPAQGLCLVKVEY
ncbi:MAG TPA: tRNA pseudouridine synthase A, partial [Terriglobia bacterium]|nr:tRNA pseudouridine synthase A [Terriglobia bacterium]